MAFGDLIYNEALPVQIPFSIGDGFTSLPGQFLITGFGAGNFKSGYFDATNNLNFTGTLTTPGAFTGIYYNEADDSYWAFAPYVTTNLDKYLFHFQSDGTPISSYDITGVYPDSVSTALSLSPDESEVLIGVQNSTDIYRFDTAGNFLGVVSFSPTGVPQYIMNCPTLLDSMIYYLQRGAFSVYSPYRMLHENAKGCAINAHPKASSKPCSCRSCFVTTLPQNGWLVIGYIRPPARCRR